MSMIHQMLALSKEQLDELLTRPETVEDFIERDHERIDECSLYKSWHLLHFLINGHPWRGEIPLGWAVYGDKELGDVDVGYGPARYLLPEQVRDVDAELSFLPAAELFEQDNPDAMRQAELYGAPTEKYDEMEKEDLRKYYKSLVRFYADAARAGYGVLTWLH